LNAAAHAAIKRALKVWRQLLALLLALAWVPLVAHCEIASVLGLNDPHEECGHDEAPPVSPDCDHCGLCQVMDGGATLGGKLTVLRPVLSTVEPCGHDSSTMPGPVTKPAPETSPPPGPFPPPTQVCLLTLRTSLPARAPSLAS
jgi:hypothetical protein